MGPIEHGAAPGQQPLPGHPALPGRPYRPPPDIDALPFRVDLPLARSAPERRLQRYDRFDRRAELVAREELTPTGTVSLEFRVVDDVPFPFEPGYFVGIQTDVDGAGPRRSPYCITSPPDEGRLFRLLVRLVPEGPVSCYLAALRVGDVITFRGPSGRSMVPKERDTALVLVATGVGVGPLLGLTELLVSQGFDRPVRLYWGLRLAEDICLVDRLDALAAGPGDFSYRISLSRPPPGWTGLRGRVTASVPPLLETLGDKHFYLVGNGAMIEEMRCALSDLGVDEQLIHRETYFNVRHRPDPRVLAELRERFVATDLFSPKAHQEAGLYLPESTRGRLPRGFSGS